MQKTIRLWNGCRALAVITVGSEGGTSLIGGYEGGASNSTKPDIELDPFRGLIVEHGTGEPPVAWREVAHEEGE